jgi:dihydroflavonol-4-reductase
VVRLTAARPLRAVVTGATGHLGAVLVRRLLDDGHHVRALVHGDAAILDGLDVERVPGDVRDPDAVRAAVAGQEIVFHLAAVIEIRKQDPDLMRAVNVEGVRNVAEAALDAGVRRMVHVSSVHAYDTFRLGARLTEAGVKSGASHPVYDRSKAAGEAALREVVARGLDAVVLNPVGVIGPWDHRPSLLGQTVMQMYRGTFRLVPEGGFCWVDVRDVVDALVAAVDRGAPGANHLLSGGALSLQDMHGIARGKCKGNAWHAVLPLALLTRIPPLVEALGLSAFSPSNFTSDALFTLGSRLDVDCALARETFGFEPRCVRASLAEGIDWWLARGYLS